jgi:hypothetical protein
MIVVIFFVPPLFILDHIAPILSKGMIRVKKLKLNFGYIKMHTKAFPQHMEAFGLVVQVINQFSYLPHHSGQVLHNLFIPKVLLPAFSPRSVR